MNLTLELQRIIADPAVAASVTQLVEKLLAESRVQVERQATELHAAKTKIDALVLELAHLRRMRFGVRSETLGAEVRDLFQETLESDIAAAKRELEESQGEAGEQAKPPRTPRERAGRQPLPAHLPRIEHRHEPESCTCGQCGKDLVLIGEDVSEQLDVEPAKFFVHRHIRPQYACRACETVTAAPIPPAVIDGGMAAVGLLAWVIVGKYLDHLPLYRLEGIAARDGVTLSRSTLAEWVGRMGVTLAPLAERLAELLRKRNVLHADETPVRQLDPGSGKTHRAYLWAYRSNDLDTGPPIVVFDYQTSRSGAHARNFLNGWQGSLMVDDFGGYKALFSAGIVELGCMAHARRKFFDLNQAQPNAIAQEALARIGVLYDIERRGRELSIKERAARREAEAVPLLRALHDWLKASRMTVANGGGTAKAIDYSLKRWAALSHYATDGALPIGRVEMWRGDRRLGLSVAAPFVWRCPSSCTVVPFPHPAHRTGRADFPHPALFQNIKPSHSKGRRRVATGVSVPAFRKGTGRSIGGTPFPACRAVASTRFADVAPYSHRSAGRFASQALG